MTFGCPPVLGMKSQVLLGEEGGWTLRAPFYDSISGRLTVLAWLLWPVQTIYCQCSGMCSSRELENCKQVRLLLCAMYLSKLLIRFSLVRSSSRSFRV